MIGHVPGGIIRVAFRIATTCAIALVMLSAAGWAQETEVAIAELKELKSYLWDFSRSTDALNDKQPDGWRRHEGIGYPKYVKVEIAPRQPELERNLRAVDTAVVRSWMELRKSFPNLKLPPSIADMIVNRFLRVDLDGGQVKMQSPLINASRMYQYRFSCQVMTQGLHFTTARAEFVFIDENNNELVVHSTKSVGGTTRWTPIMIDLVRPPDSAAKMLVRLIVERSDDGKEDIRGVIGFDDVRIDQFPQLRITTDKPLGVYADGQPIQATAKIMGLPANASNVQFRLIDSSDREITATTLAVQHRTSQVSDAAASDAPHVDSEVTWTLPRIGPGFYRVSASLDGRSVSTLATETTVAVIDKIIGGPPHGAFGWTVPGGSNGIPARQFARWLADLGVAWVKYPSWLAPDDTVTAEEVATIFGKLQDAGIQTVGMLDVPPEEEIPNYVENGRRDLVAAQLFREAATWQPRLEPVMSRLTLKVRTWQLGADRDHSFMGRSRLRDSISQISSGLQGFGQPIDIAISWPWMEKELPGSESSWQAVCRTIDPPLGPRELDSFLTLKEGDPRADGPRTWLLLDPIRSDSYDREARIRDLVLRMAVVRSHRVQAAFVSNPRDPQQGLLRPNGRPGELLLPWRTTSRLIGNLRNVGSLQLRSGAENLVFAGNDRAVLMLWSAKPTEELIYLGDNVQAVDVWGKVSNLRLETVGNQAVQRIKIGPVPTFIIGADPVLLAFRMSVDIERNQLDSFLGQVQNLSVSFANPTRDSLVGEMRVRAPEAWSVEAPNRGWEALGGRSARHNFNVVLSNTAKIGQYELPIQFEIETIPPQVITVYRKVNVGPDGLDFKVTTRLLRNNELSVEIEMTNRAGRAQSYDCMLFPPPGRQYQRRFVTVNPGETERRTIFWQDGSDLIGKQMLLRAVEQDGRRVLNYSIDVTR